MALEQQHLAQIAAMAKMELGRSTFRGCLVTETSETLCTQSGHECTGDGEVGVVTSRPDVMMG